MRLVGVLLFLFLTVSLFSQSGTRPNQIQGSPYKGGVLVTKAAYYDHARKDTFYIYQHMPIDSLGIVGGADSFYINGVWVYNGDTVNISGSMPDSIYSTSPGGTNDQILHLRDGSGTVDFDPSSLNEIQYVDGYITTAGASILSPHLLKRVNLSAMPKGGFFIPPDYQFAIDEDPFNELGESFIIADSLYYKRCQECDTLFVGIIDTSSINERGVPRISNDSLFYKECYVCTEYYYGKVIHPNDPDTLVGNEFGTLFKGDPNEIKYTPCDTCAEQVISDNYIIVDDQGGGQFEWIIPEGAGSILLDTTSTIMGLVSQYDIGGGNYHLKVRIPDRDSLNERGIPRLSNDSIFYKSGPNAAEFFVGKIIHPTTIDSTTVSSTATVTLTEAANNITADVNDGSITPVKLDRTYIEDTLSEWVIAGTEGIPIDKNINISRLGDVGIGVDSAEYKLHIKPDSDLKTILIENDTDEDMYQMLSFKNGSTGIYRRYMEWQDNTGTRTNLFGSNRQNDFIMYNNVLTYHPFFGGPTATTINAYGSQAVKINRDENTTSIGGLEVYDGTANSSTKYGEITNLGTITWGGRYMRTYNAAGTGYTSFFTDATYGYLLTPLDLYQYAGGNDIFYANGTGLRSRFNLSSNFYGFGTASPTEGVHTSGRIRQETIDAYTSSTKVAVFGSTSNQVIGYRDMSTHPFFTGYWTRTGNKLTPTTATDSIGLGVTPTEKLHVNGIVKVDRIGVTGQYLKFDGGDFLGSRIAAIGGNKSLILQSLDTGTPSTNNQMLFQLGTTASPSTKMTLDYNGNLGIGVVPVQRLHVSGNARITGLDTDNTAPTTSGTTKMVVTDNAGDLSFSNIPIITAFTNTDSIRIVEAGVTWAVKDKVNDADSSKINELQQIDTFTIVSNILRLSLGLDSVPFKSVDLTPYLDNTDAQSIDSLGFSATNTLGGSLSNDATVKTTSLRRYEHHLNSSEAEKSDNIVFIGDVEVASAAETDLRDKGVSVFRYDPDNVTLLGGAIKVDGFAGLNAVVRISPTDSISIQHYGKHLNVYARGTTDSVRVRSYDSDTSFSYSFVSNAKSTIEYTNATGFVGKTPTYDKLWTSVIKADAELFIHGIIVVGYTNIIDQSKTAINLDSLYAARWEDGWNQVVLVPNPATDTVGIKQIIARNIEGTVITNNETLVRDALNKDWTAMRLTTNFNTYQRSVNEVLEDCLNENSNVYDGATAVKDGMVFLKEGNKRYWLKRAEITGTDTLAIDGKNLYNENDTIESPRTAYISSGLSFPTLDDYAVLEIFDGDTPGNQQVEAYVASNDYTKSAYLKLTAVDAQIGRTGSSIILADSTSFNLSGSQGTSGQLLTATGTGKAKWQTPTADHGALTGLSDDDHPQYMLKYNGASAADYNTLLTNGVWRGQAGSNGPSGGTHSTFITALTNSTNYGFQLAGTTGDGFYMRNMTSTWDSWYQLASRTWVTANHHTGSLSSGYVPKATGTLTLSNSLIYDNGTNVGINDATPSYRLDVSGDIRATDFTGGSLASYLGRDASGQIIDAATPTASGSAGGDLTGTYPSPTVATSAINSAKILDNSIVSGDIQNGTIQAADIAGNTITSAEIDANAIGSSELASTTVSAGSYTNTNLTVDADGRITAASNGSASGALTAGTESGGSIPLQLTGSPDLYLTQGTNVNLVRLAANEIEFNVTGGLTDGDKGDITVSGSGATFAIDAAVIVNADISGSAAIDATKIANGSVSNTEFQYINSVTSNVQTQLDGKASTSHTHTQAGGTWTWENNSGISVGSRLNLTGSFTNGGISTNLSTESINLSGSSANYYLLSIDVALTSYTSSGTFPFDFAVGLYSGSTLLKTAYMYFDEVQKYAVMPIQTAASGISDFNIKIESNGEPTQGLFGNFTLTKIH